jgi:hypothetical protein
MRDEYPPFRFDGGGTDPGSKPVAPPPTRPEAPAGDQPAADPTISTPTPTG